MGSIWSTIGSILVVLANPTDPGDIDDKYSLVDAVSSSDTDTDNDERAPGHAPQHVQNHAKLSVSKQDMNMQRHEVEEITSFELPFGKPMSNGRPIMHEYGVPGPPPRSHNDSRQSNNLSSFRSVVSADGFASSLDSSIQHHSKQLSPSFISSPIDPVTLTSRNVSVDAYACRPPRRIPVRSKPKHETVVETVSDLKTKGPSKGELSHNFPPTIKNDPGNVQRNGKDTVDDIENFIFNFVKYKNGHIKHIKFFDAAVVYDKKDYDEVQQFIFDVQIIVKARLEEDVRIELFDSVEFAQSRVMVVEDVVERCSIVFVYLTNNCDEETLRLFCDEGIGMTRLGNLSSHNPWAHERQWMLKPVHTQPMKSRRYKTPVGLVSVRGIDWYDKASSYTRDRLVHLMEHAISQRKRRETEANKTPDISRQTKRREHVRDAIPIREIPTKHADVKPFNVHTHSLSEDALSFESHTTSTYSFDTVERKTEQGPTHVQYPSNRDRIDEDMFQFSPVPSNHPHVAQPHLHINHPQQVHPGYMDQYRSQTVNPMTHIHGQAGLNTQIPGYVGQYPYQPQYLQYTLQAQPPQFQSQLPYGQQMLNDQDFVIQSAGVRPPQPIQGNNCIPQINGYMQQNQTLQNNVYSSPNHASHSQTAPRSEHQSGISIPGNYMRDKRNDAPATSDLSVVSRVTGKLIVNPNLSTDDIEVDDPSGRGETEYIPKSPKNQRIAGNASGHHGSQGLGSRGHTSDHIDPSSSDSDLDIPMSRGKSKSSKGKVLNIIGCQNIQLGSGNQVVERKSSKRRKRSSKKSSSSESRETGDSDMNNLKLSESHTPDMCVDRSHRSSGRSRNSVHEDCLDLTQSTQGRADCSPPNNPTAPGEEPTSEYLGEIRSDIYQRRVHKWSQSQSKPTSTSEAIEDAQEMNCLDKPGPEKRVTVERNSHEYNLVESRCNASDTENISDGELFGEAEVFEEVRHERSTPGLQDFVETSANSEPEEKAYNKEACFSFSYFKTNQQKIMLNSLQSLEKKFSSDTTDEVDLD